MTRTLPFVLSFFAVLSAFSPAQAEPEKYVIGGEITLMPGFEMQRKPS